MTKLIAQQGAWVYMVDDGTADVQGAPQEMARVYDRQQATLSEPMTVQSLLARGYWENVTSLPETQKLVAEEIAALT